MGPPEVDEPLESFGADIGKRTNSYTRVREWLLVEGDRLVVAAGITAGTFVLLLTLNAVGVIGFVNDDSMTRLAGGMIAGTFSLVTLVVSINQLILSREFAAAGETRDRLDGVLEFRGDIAEMAGVPAPPASPSKLLELLVETIHHRALAVGDSVAAHDDYRERTLIARYVARVRESTERVDATLEETSFGAFTAVSAAIGYDDSWQLYAARHLRNDHAETLSAETLEAFDDLIEALALFAIAREHFMTTYLQRELTRFSQLTILTGVPAILSAMLFGLLYGDLGGAAISLEYVPIVACVLISIVVSPLSLLVAYILRTATVSRRTSSTGPMLPQKDPEEGPFEVSYGGARDE